MSRRIWDETTIDQKAAALRDEFRIQIKRKTIIDRSVEDGGPYIQVGYTWNDDHYSFYTDVSNFDRSDEAWITAICQERAWMQLHPRETEDNDGVMGMRF